jgi:ribonuclease HII
MSELFITDLSCLNNTSAKWLIGVDEVGRGPLAGPVTATAVAIRRDWYLNHEGSELWSQINDSKQLTPAKREQFYDMAVEAFRYANHCFCFETATASVKEIDRLNILEATKLAMARALLMLESRIRLGSDGLPRNDESEMFELGSLEGDPEVSVLIDGRELKHFPYRHTAIVKGDGKSFCIAMASIIAKVKRDALMKTLSAEFPEYGWEKNKGYGTAVHRKAILALGPTIHHRTTFLRRMTSGIGVE